ncbi:MAG: right-handed parallel beta-helix repeat-containing protein [Candidatus Krumholzibacteriota bacterium]|nr:right-handed parallel beta-helix repeat-containing protein [Candidatus Krumholzibacteriota bacterium]
MRANSNFSSVLSVLLPAVLIFTGCDKSLGFHNKAPVISSISKSACYVGTNGVLDLVCDAQDPDEDPILVRWSASGGEFIPAAAEGEMVSWRPPPQPGTYTVTATVSDDIDESSMSIEIDVGKELTVEIGNTVLANDVLFYVISASGLVPVLEGATLTIEAGVTVVVNQRGGGLSVRGELEINGRSEDPVYFKPNVCPGENGVWEGLVFTGENASGSMTNVNISMAVGAVSVSGGAVVSVDSCFIHDGAGIGITAENSTISIYECRVSDNSGGIHVVDSDADIIDCQIRDNGAYGIWLEENESETKEARDVTVEGCDIATNYNDGIIISWRGLPVINYNSILHNGTFSGGYDLRLYQYFNTAGVDARYNYWGVITEDEIREVIFDGSNYLPPAPSIYVDFSGYLDSQP